jgi:lysyl-tRNA synthetase, class II
LEFEPRDQLIQRQKKLEQIAALGFDPYPTKFEWKQTAAQIVAEFGDRAAEALQQPQVNVSVAGRIVTIRLHGKAGFAHIQGDGQRLQIYVKLDAVGPRFFQLFQLLDIGDVIGVSGHLFRTKTNELTVWVEQITLLTKALLPLPEKWHGLADVEMRYRRRYLDLIANDHVRQIFLRRAQIIHYIRGFFDARNYVEVETPMMHPILGGATARPFVTRHNTFDVDFYMRIAPELYLKRLVVGGLDRVYEINRNFRNEGIDAIHLPEFTMLEFYEAYSDYRDLMKLTEELFSGVARTVCGGMKIKYGEHEIDFGHFEKLSMREAIVKFWPDYAGAKPAGAEFKSADALLERLRIAVKELDGIHGQQQPWTDPGRQESIRILRATLWEIVESSRRKSHPLGWIIGAVFEAVAEEHLIQPTFIYDFPADISPLSKRRRDDPALAERFELFIEGMELANGFSELNDPADQEARFRAQVEAGGLEMPKEIDWDYIRALAHGLPPTAGEGVGIDRLVMLLTDSRAIREVILFPTLRPQKDEETDAAAASHEEHRQ